MTTDRTSTDPAGVAAVLAQAAAAAGFAPSIHNTQPWRWRVTRQALDLYAARNRQLEIADPDGRLLTISCGAALHHARVALAAEGWTETVSRLPDPDDPDHLARITLTGRTPVAPEATSLFQTVQLRHTDRRPVSDIPPSPEAIAAVRRAATDEGVNMHLLSTDQVFDLGVEAAVADRAESVSPDQRTELAYWIGGDRAGGNGIPDAALPRFPQSAVVPGRDFVRTGTLPAGQGYDRAAAYVLLFGAGDEPADWLRAGEGLSAAWLTATEQGLTVLPFSSVIEVTPTRETLRRMLGALGYPFLVLRLGSADPREAAPPHAPRLPTNQIVDISLE